MTHKLKVAVIGGGSSYTPELVEGFIKRYKEFPLTQLWLADIEDGKEKLEIVGALAERMTAAADIPCQIRITLERAQALQDADFVITQIRAGLLDGRIKDERIPLSHGMIGQETNGAGGIFNALRTVPVILDIVEDMKKLCPNAWLINFANPSGMVTEAVFRYGGWNKVVGLCNLAVNAIAEESALLGEKEENLFFQFAGINHLHWHRVVDKKGIERTEQLCDMMFRDGEGKSTVANIKNNPLLYEQVKNLHMLPCPYHGYYYLTDQKLKEELDEFKQHGTRAEQVKQIEHELFERYKDPGLKEKPKELAKRGGARYSDAACETITSIYNNKGKVMTVCTLNNGAISDLPDNCVVEVTCAMTGHGPAPFNFGRFLPQERGLLQLMKCMELLTVEAAVTGDRGALMQAFTLNPLIVSGNTAKAVMEELLEAHRKYLPAFYR